MWLFDIFGWLLCVFVVCVYVYKLSVGFVQHMSQQTVKNIALTVNKKATDSTNF